MRSSSTSRRAVLLGIGLLLLAGAAAAQSEAAPPERQADYSPYPNPDAGYVTDHAGVMSSEEQERLERWLWQAESRSRTEIIIVVIGSLSDYPGTANGSIEAFARALFDSYGIGNMPANDGVLLLVAIRDRKARIELGAGYDAAADVTARRIMDEEILPAFRKNDYADGIRAGTEAILLEFAGLRVASLWPRILAISAAIMVLALLAFSLFKSGKRGWGWVCVGLIVVLLLWLIWMVTQAIRHMPTTSSSGWSSGGIGGFGGGFSGGGGATGSW